MIANKIRHILCAVLGTPASRTTVTQAIDLASEHNARLTFVHVINAEFLASAAPTMTSLRTVYNQLRELGEFSMLILCDRANRRGVENADYILREGQILPQLRVAISEIQPDIFIIGKPLEAELATHSIPPEDIESFIDDIEKNLGVTVLPVEIQPES
jgi:nucleotide-binding universal stress UspA family protein